MSSPSKFLQLLPWHALAGDTCNAAASASNQRHVAISSLHVWQVSHEPSHTAVFGAVALAEVDSPQDAEDSLDFAPDVHHTRFWQTHFGISSASLFVEEGRSQVQISIWKTPACRAALCSSKAVCSAFSQPTVGYAPRR